MTIDAKILADSISPAGQRLTSFELYYPREQLHEEVLTHRSFSRCASSSRATPVKTMIDQVKRDPAIPLRWGRAGTGMSDHGEMTPAGAEIAKKNFLKARDASVAVASQMLNESEVAHKQIINLMLRPWEHITVVMTSAAPGLANFFALRMDAGAKPEMRALAGAMLEVYRASTPASLLPGQWHLPYMHKSELENLVFNNGGGLPSEMVMKAIQVSVARCARTSYKNHRGKISTFAEDLDLFGRLTAEEIKHASPAEHQATPDVLRKIYDPKQATMQRTWEHPELHGNLPGWCQFRKMIPGEFITTPYEGNRDVA